MTYLNALERVLTPGEVAANNTRLREIWLPYLAGESGDVPAISGITDSLLRELYDNGYRAPNALRTRLLAKLDPAVTAVAAGRGFFYGLREPMRGLPQWRDVPTIGGGQPSGRLDRLFLVDGRVGGQLR